MRVACVLTFASGSRVIECDPDPLRAPARGEVRLRNVQRAGVIPGALASSAILYDDAIAGGCGA